MGFLKNLFTVSLEDLKKNVESKQKEVDNRQNMLDWAKSVLKSRQQQQHKGSNSIADSKKKVDEYKIALQRAKDNLKIAKEKLRNAKK